MFPKCYRWNSRNSGLRYFKYIIKFFVCYYYKMTALTDMKWFHTGENSLHKIWTVEQYLLADIYVTLETLIIKYSGRINQRTARACWLVSSGNNRSSAICKNWATLCELIACERWPGIWSADQSKTQILHTFYHIWEICLLQGKICVIQLTDLKVVISQYWKQQLIIMTTFTFQKH